MSKALKPSRLDVDPNSPTAAKQWKHWKRTFDNFITECGADAPDKFRSIINFISADVFEYVEECTNYIEVIDTLTRLYIKTPNKIFARYELATRKQKPNESLDEFLEELRKLGKHGNFEAVTAEVYRSEMIRDSFINGLSSNYIRQSLLENAELTLDQAYQQARTLHIAQKNSEAYVLQGNQSIPANVAAATTDSEHTPVDINQETLAAIRKQQSSKRSCYFCGGSLHVNRKNCPAVDATCHNCSRKGHFAKVCQSSKKNPSLSTIFKPSLCAITAACPPSLNHASLPVLVNGMKLTALIDSCSSNSFISEKAFHVLNIPLKPSNKKVSMALTSMESYIIGHCNLNVVVSGQTYDKVHFDILKDLCSDIILGYDFQKQHQKLTFCLGGTKPDLVVSTINYKRTDDNNAKTLLADKMDAEPQESQSCITANIEPPSLFKNLSNDIKPVATKSRHFNKDDRAFIENQVSSLLKAGHIQRSDSPWRAQVVIVRDDIK